MPATTKNSHRSSDPQDEVPGACDECEGNHSSSRCPAVARHNAAQQRRTVGQLQRAAAAGDRVAERQVDAYFDAHPSI